MESMCTRCAYRALHPQKQLYHGAQLGVIRSFTTSIRQRADASEGGKPVSSSARQPPRPTDTTNGAASPSINSVPQGGLLIRRTSANTGNQPPRSTGPPQGSLLRRTGAAPPAGQVLRRTGPPRQGGAARTGPPGRSQGPPGKQRRRRTAESVKAREAEDEDAPQEEIDEYMTKFIDPPANPTERITYNPQPQDVLELQKDWPNTPMSATGLSASLVQKIEWLARRLPHGYQTPEQLAEHFHKGYLTRFESEEEKKQVLKIATELAQKRASLLSERKGTEVTVEDMTMSELSSRDEKKKLISEVVTGEVSDLERQRMPFLESVMRNLNNNQTYHKPEMDRFMEIVQRLMPAQAQRRPQQQTQKSS